MATVPGGHLMGRAPPPDRPSVMKTNPKAEAAQAKPRSSKPVRRRSVFTGSRLRTGSPLANLLDVCLWGEGMNHGVLLQGRAGAIHGQRDIVRAIQRHTIGAQHIILPGFGIMKN